MGVLSDLRGLTTETVKVGSLDVPIRGVTNEEWAALEGRFPELEGILSGKSKPSPGVMAALVALGLQVNGETVEEEDVRALAAGTVMILGNAILVATFPQVKAPLEEALQKAGLQRAAGAAPTAPPAKRSPRSSKR